MDKPRRECRIGAPWIAAMIVPAVALVVGLVLYFQMSAPLREPVGAVGAPPAAAGRP